MASKGVEFSMHGGGSGSDSIGSRELWARECWNDVKIVQLTSVRAHLIVEVPSAEQEQELARGDEPHLALWGVVPVIPCSSLLFLGAIYLPRKWRHDTCVLISPRPAAS